MPPAGFPPGVTRGRSRGFGTPAEPGETSAQRNRPEASEEQRPRREPEQVVADDTAVGGLQHPHRRLEEPPRRTEHRQPAVPEPEGRDRPVRGRSRRGCRRRWTRTAPRARTAAGPARAARAVDPGDVAPRSRKPSAPCSSRCVQARHEARREPERDLSRGDAVSERRADVAPLRALRRLRREQRVLRRPPAEEDARARAQERAPRRAPARPSRAAAPAGMLLERRPRRQRVAEERRRRTGCRQPDVPANHSDARHGSARPFPCRRSSSIRRSRGEHDPRRRGRAPPLSSPCASTRLRDPASDFGSSSAMPMSMIPACEIVE